MGHQIVGRFFQGLQEELFILQEVPVLLSCVLQQHQLGKEACGARAGQVLAVLMGGGGRSHKRGGSCAEEEVGA